MDGNLNTADLELPKLLAFDLDGTLLPASKELTPFTLKVLSDLRDMGCQLTVSTGKFHHLALRYGHELGLDLPQISLDGATVGGNGHEELRRCISLETTHELIDTYQPLAKHSFADDGNDKMLLRSDDSNFRLATRFWAAEALEVEDLKAHIGNDSAVVTFYGDEEPMQEMKHQVARDFPQLRIAEFWSEYLECRRITFQPSGVDKGSGVLQVADGIGVKSSECMVFGDWLNDLPMFQIGAVAVAMKNAVGALHAEADHITEESCEEDGVARFLQNAFL